MARYKVNWNDGSEVTEFENAIPYSLKHTFIDDKTSHIISVTNDSGEEFNLSVEDIACNVVLLSENCTVEFLTLPMNQYVGDTYVVEGFNTDSNFTFDCFTLDDEKIEEGDERVKDLGEGFYSFEFVSTKNEHKVKCVFKSNSITKTITSGYYKTKLTIS